MSAPREWTFSATLRSDGTATASFVLRDGTVQQHELTGIGAELLAESTERWITVVHLAAMVSAIESAES